MTLREETAERRRELFTEAVAILEAEYASSLHLEAVARRLATSRRQLQRSFGEAGGTSFIGCLTAVRMERARLLLRDTSLPVFLVAKHVGYQRGAQFATKFRHHHRMSPLEFRRRCATENELASVAQMLAGAPA